MRKSVALALIKLANRIHPPAPLPQRVLGANLRNLMGRPEPILTARDMQALYERGESRGWN